MTDTQQQEPLSWQNIGYLTPQQAEERRDEIRAFIKSTPLPSHRELDRQERLGQPAGEDAEPITWEMIGHMTPDAYEARRYDVQHFMKENLR